jgi:predicted PurR-regulated permease PerM
MTWASMNVSPASDSAERKEIPLPTDAKAMLLTGIFGLLLFYGLYVTGEIVIPILIAFLLKLVLQPIMETLVSFHLPRFLAALLIVCVLLAGVSGLGIMLAGPAANWVSKAPQSLAKVETKLAAVSAMARDFQKATHDVEKLGEDASQPAAVAVKGPPLSTFLFSGTRALTAGLVTVVVLLYFLLVSGNSFLRRLVEILPTMRNKKQAIEITNEIQRTVATYLGTVTVMNALVGVATGVAVHFCGLGDPVLWGAVAFLLNFVPIVGPLVGVAVLGLAGLLSFETVWQALLPAGIYLGIHLIEGEAVTPMLLARRLTLNPVAVIIALVFWYWMWGVAGALLAVPMLATLKIFCDRVERFMAIGHFLGTEAREMASSPS